MLIARFTHIASAIAAAVFLPLVAQALAADAHAPAEAPAAHPAAAPAHAPSVSATEGLKMLADGNARFVAGTSTRPHQDHARLDDTFANGQHPYAAVLSCADSRVPPELVFDAGIGDLFVIRVAGNVADVDEIGSVEYGVEHLGVHTVLVLGHTKCGAVTAVVEHEHATKSIEELVHNIVPAVEEARRDFPKLAGPELLNKAIELNVRRQMADLVSGSDVIRDAVKEGKVKVVGGVYDLHTGKVNWLEAPSSHAASGSAPAAPAHSVEAAVPAR
jgi:carbonic anhydrase